MLPIKLRSERCANDLNHFQLKVPSGTFSIAEICNPRYDIARVDSLNYSDAGLASLCSTCHNFKLALFYAISPSSW